MKKVKTVKKVKTDKRYKIVVFGIALMLIIAALGAMSV